MSEKPNRIMVKQNVHNEYVVRIARPITEPDDFDDELTLLAGAGKEDSIKLIVCSPGGSLDTANLIVKGLRETSARTLGYIGGTCASAATGIILACDEWEIDENSSFMIHTASFGSYGKAPEVESEVIHKLKKIRQWVQNTYTGFLSDEEIQQVIDGKDFYFDGHELAERLMAYDEYRENARQQMYAQMLDTEEEEA